MGIKYYVCGSCKTEYFCEIKTRKEIGKVTTEKTWKRGGVVMSKSDADLLDNLICIECDSAIRAKFSCNDCKFLEEKSEERVKRVHGHQFKDRAIFYVCAHPKINEGVRDFERASNCDYYFNKRTMKTLEGWT